MEDSVNARMDDAVLNYNLAGIPDADGNPRSKVQESIDEQKELVTSFAKSKGIKDQKQIDSMILDRTSKTHEAVIRRMIQNDDPAAENYFKDAVKAKEMDAATVVRMEGLVENSSRLKQSQSATDDIMAKYEAGSSF